MPAVPHEQYELSRTSSPPARLTAMHDDEVDTPSRKDTTLHLRTLRKLDWLLLPFLASLFLFNSLDKSNIGNAETAHFTESIGLKSSDLNTAVALFFAFFVALQPVGAACGRRYGMVLWVPSCMLLWGIATALHIWVRARWQLYTLRILIGCLEAGFYPVTVSYLSLFYTRFEFARRLSIFYGQAAVGGALGGILSYVVFRAFPVTSGGEKDPDLAKKWQSWQVLFLLEGGLTMVVATVGYFWLPHSVETAWFLTVEERAYASSRITHDRMTQSVSTTQPIDVDEDEDHDDESHGLLSSARHASVLHEQNVIDDRGISPHDIRSALCSPIIWHILFCNILSSMPVYAFQVFLPLVLAPLTKVPSMALVNLLTAPPYLIGAIMLFLFASYSDRHRIRIGPILVGLAIMVVSLAFVVLLPVKWAIPRYLILNVLVSGTFIASPLTVAWISGNTPSPGKRALLLGVNGWGNLAGVFSAMLFQPSYAKGGYIVPFWWTLACVATSAVGYLLLWRNLREENARRRALVAKWKPSEVDREKLHGQGPVRHQRNVIAKIVALLKRNGAFPSVVAWLEASHKGGREGDEKMTFQYGL